MGCDTELDRSYNGDFLAVKKALDLFVKYRVAGERCATDIVVSMFRWSVE